MYVTKGGMIIKIDTIEPKRGTIEPKRGTNMDKPIPHDVTLEEAYTEAREILLELVVNTRLDLINGLAVMNEQGEAEVILGVDQIKKRMIRAETFLGKQLSA
jgi:hypothetical protein